jgi:hypothetical protein
MIHAIKTGLLCALLTLGSAAALGQTTQTYTGVIKDLAQNVVTSGQVSFTLAPPSDATIPGVGRFTPFTLFCTINTNGTLSGYVAGVVSGACIVTSNTALSPSGTSYQICLQPQFATPGSCFYDYALGGTKDISTVAPTLRTGPINYGAPAGPAGPTGATGPQGNPGVGGASIPMNLVGNDALCIEGGAGGINYDCILTTAAFTQTASATGIGERDITDSFMTRYGPGVDLGNAGGWSVNKLAADYLTVAQRGIAQGRSLVFTHQAVGDTMGFYNYVWSDGGTAALSDEAIKLGALNGGEVNGYYHGSVTGTSGAGDTVPSLSTATSGSNWTTDGARLLDISKGTISGTLNGNSATLAGSYLLDFPVAGVTLPLTSSWCASTSNFTPPTTPANQTSSITINCTLGTIGGGTPAMTVGLATVAGPNYPEQARITAVGTPSGGVQSITLSVRNPNGGLGGYSSTHPALFQGGISGQAISFDQDLAASGFRTSFLAVGSLTGTDLIYWSPLAGGAQFQTLPLPGSVVTTSGGGFHLYPYCEVITNQSMAANPICEPNAVPWAVGDTVENPHYGMVNTMGLNINLIQNTPSNNGQSFLDQETTQGYGVSGPTYFGSTANNGNPASMYAGFGGPLALPLCGFCVRGLWKYPFWVSSMVPGGAVINVVSEQGPLSPYYLFQVTGGGQLGNILLDPTTGSWSMANLDGTVLGQYSARAATVTSLTATSLILNVPTVAASNCGSLAGAAGCITATIGGATHYVPYW